MNYNLLSRNDPADLDHRSIWQHGAVGAHLNVQHGIVFASAGDVESLIAGVVHGVGEVSRRWMIAGIDSLIHALGCVCGLRLSCGRRAV